MQAKYSFFPHALAFTGLIWPVENKTDNERHLPAEANSAMLDKGGCEWTEIGLVLETNVNVVSIVEYCVPWARNGHLCGFQGSNSESSAGDQSIG